MKFGGNNNSNNNGLFGVGGGNNSSSNFGNNRNYNSGPTYQQGPYNVQNINADSIIRDIVTTVRSVLTTSTTAHVIIDKLKEYHSKGHITIVGTGTNRMVFRINHPMGDIINRSGLPNTNINVVCKVPYNLLTGRKDNLKEQFVYNFIQRVAVRNDATKYEKALSKLILPCKIIDNEGYVLLEKEVIPIEKTKAVQDMMTAKGYTKNEIGSAVLDVFLENPSFKEEYKNLMQSLDDVFVFSDLNIFYSRFNLGVDKIGGVDHLVPLDLGYCLPKMPYLSPNLTCPTCGHELHYVYLGDGFLEGDEYRRKRFEQILRTKYGLYSCKNPNCTHNGKGNDPFYIYDMDAFIHYQNNIRNNLLSKMSKRQPVDEGLIEIL